MGVETATQEPTMRTIALTLAAVLTLTAFASAAALAREIKAPEGCYLRIDRDGTFVCCPTRKKNAYICRQQNSTLAQ